jgi:hypothetical protein
MLSWLGSYPRFQMFLSYSLFLMIIIYYRFGGLTFGTAFIAPSTPLLSCFCSQTLGCAPVLRYQVFPYGVFTPRTDGCQGREFALDGRLTVKTSIIRVTANSAGAPETKTHHAPCRNPCLRPSKSAPVIPRPFASRGAKQRPYLFPVGGGLCEFSLTTAIISSIPSLISLTCGCTSRMRSCSILENFSIRLPCSRSWSKRKFCLTERRRIHQKQTAQQRVPARVIQKDRLLRLIVRQSSTARCSR